MKILENKLLLTLVLALFSLQILAVPTDVAISFDEVYPYSIAYSISNLNNVQQNKNCSFVNSLTNQILECELGEQCKCSEGTLIGLEANTVYPIMVRIKPDNVELIPSTDVKTAAVGELEWSYGISTVTYNISYSRNQVAPFSCDPTLISFDSDHPDVYQLVTDRSCESGTFTGLLANREYSLTISSNGSVIHENVVNTGYFNVTVNQTGIKTVGFYSQTNLDDIYLEECEIFNNSTGAPASCLDGQCSCTGGIINDLQPNTNYSFRFVRGVESLSNLSVTTASTGEMSLSVEYMTLQFNISYPNQSKKPSLCVPCLVSSTENATIDDCRDIVRDFVLVSVFCERYYYSNLEEGSMHDNILFDENYDVVSELRQNLVPTTTVNQTSMQLTSAGYIVETDFPLDPNQPCQFLDTYDRRLLSCDSGNGQKSTNCSCQSGKIVDLQPDIYMDSYLYQNDKQISHITEFYTADHGQLTIENSGLYSMEYSVSYYSYSYPPQNCITCTVPLSNGVKNCDKSSFINNTQVCNKHTFKNLTNSTKFNLLIFDGDMKQHTKKLFYTAGTPIETVFHKSDDTIDYILTYKNKEDIPSKCQIYFVEDPSYQAQCSTITCDCRKGSVVLPVDQKNLTRIYITDFSGNTIVEMSVQKSIKLSGGVIAGIVIGVVAVIAIVAGLTAYFITRK